MNCKVCQQEMICVFDKTNDTELCSKVMEHIESCTDCRNEYLAMQKTLSAMRPGVNLSAPFLLKQKIVEQIKMEEPNMKNQESRTIRISNKAKKIISVAAVLAAVMIILPIVTRNSSTPINSVQAANSIMESSIKASSLVKSMLMEFNARTEPNDNFALISVDGEMVRHSFAKKFDSPVNWRIEKPGRVVVFDGKHQYLWAESLGMAIKGSENDNFTEWYRTFLEPEKILEKEKNAIKDKDTKLLMEEKDGKIYMSITSKAKGSFINDYCKNSSIEESDNRREYVFSKETKLLLGLKVFILLKDKEVLVLESTKIEYDSPIDPSTFKIELPKGTEWKENSNIYESLTFKNVGSKKAAEIFFQAMKEEKWDVAAEGFPILKTNSEKITEFKNYFAKLTIISIGEPFKSGNYPGEFVPYEIKTAKGESIKGNLAVRNDNPNKVNIIDGGL